MSTTPWLLPRRARGLTPCGSDVRQILEIARSGSPNDRTLALLHRIIDNAEVACRDCKQPEPLIYCVPVEAAPDTDGRERCEFLCPLCAGRLRDQITEDARECPECGDVAHLRWCCAHDRRVPRVPIETTRRVDAALAGVRAAVGGTR